MRTRSLDPDSTAPALASRVNFKDGIYNSDRCSSIQHLGNQGETCKHFLGGGLLPHGLQHCLHLLPLPEGENNPSVKILSKNWHQISKDCVVYDVLQSPTSLTNQWAIHLFARSCEPIRFLRNFRQRFSFPILRIFGSLPVHH